MEILGQHHVLNETRTWVLYLLYILFIYYESHVSFMFTQADTQINVKCFYTEMLFVDALALWKHINWSEMMGGKAKQ